MFVRAGFAFDYMWFHAVVAPDLWYAQNKSFEIFPSPDSARSRFGVAVVCAAALDRPSVTVWRETHLTSRTW